MIKPQFSFLYGGKPYENGNGPIKTTVVTKKHEKFDAVEWVVWYENTSSENSEKLSQIRDCDVVLPLPEYVHEFMGFRYTDEAPKIVWMQGLVEGEAYSYDDERSAQEFSFHTDYFHGANVKHSYENGEGRGSDEIMPFFEIACKGKGYIAAIGWTGSWIAEFQNQKEGVCMKAGLHYADFYLKPGEKVRGASILVMEYNENDDKYNKFRDLMRENYTPKNVVKNNHGIFANLFWGGLSSEEMINRINRFRENGVCFDHYWVDAAWNGKKAKSDCNFDSIWAEEVGDWEIKLDAHPDEFKEVCRNAKQAGAGFMLWFDLEKATAVTPIAQQHPEYFIDADQGYLLADFSKKEVRDYYFEVLKKHIETLDISCYRQDFNCTPDVFWAKADEPDRRGITEIYHTLGLYEVWDRLLEAFPNLIIDNCASGGRRIDIETLQRTIPFFRTDYQCVFNPNPDVTNTHNTNASRLIPCTGCTTKKKGDTYAARSTYSTSWGMGCYATVFHAMSDEDVKWLAGICKEYKSIRDYFIHHFHNHASSGLDSTSWVIWQYHDPAKDEGVIMAFRRADSPCAQAQISLKELQGEYKFYDFDSKNTFVSGKDITITLEEKYSSAIITYKK